MVAEPVPGGYRLPELHAGAVEGHDGVPRVADAAPQVGVHHLIVHLQRRQEDVPVRIHLVWRHGKEHLSCAAAGSITAESLSTLNLVWFMVSVRCECNDDMNRNGTWLDATLEILT